MTTQTDPATFETLASPPLSPPVINLVTSSRNPAPVDPDGKPLRWELGFGYQPIPNVPAAGYDWRADAAIDANDPQERINVAPWLAEVSDKCSAIGFSEHAFVDRALAGLRAATPKQVETEFWTGAIAQASGCPNLYLAADVADILNPTLGTAVSQAEAFELLEQAIADAGCGGRGMIHVPAELTPILTGVRREGNLLLTARDTIVVSGSGYDGSGPPSATGHAPTATTAWAYATGIVSTFIGDPYLEPAGSEVTVLTARQVAPAGAEPGDDSELSAVYSLTDLDALDATFRAYFLDRDTNTVTARARRPVAATWDGVCHAAVLVNINT